MDCNEYDYAVVGQGIAGTLMAYFLKESGIDKASILAYYSIFSSFFLLIFFSFVFSKFFGDPGNAVKNMYPFSPDFFSSIAPFFFQKAGELAAQVEDLGLVGLFVFLFVGIMVFKKMIHYINDMFFIKLKPGILFRRIKEVGLLVIVGILIVFSFLVTGMIAAVNSLAEENPFLKNRIDPAFVHSIDNLLVRFILPFLVTFLFFFILFGFWMELTMSIMLYGAKFTYLLDTEENGKLKKTR